MHFLIMKSDGRQIQSKLHWIWATVYYDPISNRVVAYLNKTCTYVGMNMCVDSTYVDLDVLFGKKMPFGQFCTSLQYRFTVIY